jgi:Fimbrial assembly protein (PilN)
MGSPNQLSFLPDDYLERKAQRRTNAVCAILFLLVIGGVGSAFTLSENATKAIDKQWSKIEEQYVNEAKRIEQVKQMHAKQQRMAHQAELTASLLEKVPRSHLLAEVTNCLAPGVSLLEFSMESKVRQRASGGEKPMTAYEMKKAQRENMRKGGSGDKEAPQAEAKLFDVYMKVTGTAYNDGQVAQFIAKLSKSKLLKDVNLSVSDEYNVGDDKLRKFQIEMMLDPDVDITNLARKAAAETTNIEVQE